MLPKIAPRNNAKRRATIERDLIRKEAQIGASVFGPVPKGHIRQFFCLDAHTWVWHEEWSDSGQKQVVTTRYNVRPNGILKSQNGQPYQPLTPKETHNLRQAAHLYRQKVHAMYQQMLQAG